MNSNELHIEPIVIDEINNINEIEIRSLVEIDFDIPGHYQPNVVDDDISGVNICDKLTAAELLAATNIARDRANRQLHNYFHGKKEIDSLLQVYASFKQVPSFIDGTRKKFSTREYSDCYGSAIKINKITWSLSFHVSDGESVNFFDILLIEKSVKKLAKVGEKYAEITVPYSAVSGMFGSKTFWYAQIVDKHFHN